MNLTLRIGSSDLYRPVIICSRMYSPTKCQKLYHLPEALAYPNIPESAQDREETSNRERWQERPVWRLIESWLFPLLLFGMFC